MARLRTIKPEFFQNEDLAELSLATRLLFIGLWTLADRRGILEDRPKRIKALLFPYDDIDVQTALSDLKAAGFINRYTVNGVPGIHIIRFTAHQNPHINERENDVPEPQSSPVTPEQHGASTVQAPEQHSASNNFVSPLSVKGMVNGVGSGDLSLGRESPSKPITYPSDFEQFWEQYPSGHGVKKTTAAQWQKLKPDERLDAAAGLARWKSCERWREGYIKPAELWLRDRWWENDPPPPKPVPIRGKGSGDQSAQMDQWANELKHEMGQV